MDEQYLLRKLLNDVKSYAEGRANDVARGAETPHLAALLLQKYGLGMCAALRVNDETFLLSQKVLSYVDEETAKIDPLWREHMKERWAGRPADVVSFNKEEETK